ncbi:MAG TPA: DoxX family protein [Bryobacteraceae bacterium]
MQERKSSFRDASIGYLSLRIALGLVIFLHGVVRLAGHYEQFVNSTVQGFLKSPLPTVAVHVAALCIPPAEAVIGLFLLRGFLTRLALVGGALPMLILLFGKSLQQDWSTVAIQLEYAFLYALLLALRRWNQLSLDGLLRRMRMPETADDL